MSTVKGLIETYPRDRYLYLHRRTMIVECLKWELSDEFVRGFIRLERVVTGTESPHRTWDFAVRWDDVNLVRLDRRMLSGCQLSDTIVLDPDLFDAALSVNPDSEESVLTSFRNRVINTF